MVLAWSAISAAPFRLPRRCAATSASSDRQPSIHFSKAVAEHFSRANPGVPAPIVESTGTGPGMKLFCGGVGAGHPDITNASRRMKLSEFRGCAANGVSQITEIQVGLDGIAIATARATGLNNLTTQELYYALAKTPFGKPNPTKTWKDVNSSYPAIPIRIYGPPSTSGTRSSVEDLLMEPGCVTSPAMVAMKKANEARYNQICKTVREDGAYIEGGENDNLMVQRLGCQRRARSACSAIRILEENHRAR